MKCKKQVLIPGVGFGRTRQCSRNAVEDGFCRMHHPTAVKKRSDERLEKFNRRVETETSMWRDARRYRALRDLEIKIRFLGFTGDRDALDSVIDAYIERKQQT